MQKITILIVDDDELVTMSLGMILGAEPDLKIIGKGNSGADAIRLYDELKPDILMMDIRMSDMNGVDAAEIILRNNNDAVILFLTTFQDDEYIIKALQLGVKGYILKQNYDSIPDCIRAVMRGQNVFGGEIIRKMPKIFESQNKESGVNNAAVVADDYVDDESAEREIYRRVGITPKEYEVIQFVALGYSNKEISERIFLSEGTIKNYISNILDKLDLRDRTQLAIFHLKNKETNRG